MFKAAFALIPEAFHHHFPPDEIVSSDFLVIKYMRKKFYEKILSSSVSPPRQCQRHVLRDNLITKLNSAWCHRVSTREFRNKLTFLLFVEIFFCGCLKIDTHRENQFSLIFFLLILVHFASLSSLRSTWKLQFFLIKISHLPQIKFCYFPFMARRKLKLKEWKRRRHDIDSTWNYWQRSFWVKWWDQVKGKGAKRTWKYFSHFLKKRMNEGSKKKNTRKYRWQKISIF